MFSVLPNIGAAFRRHGRYAGKGPAYRKLALAHVQAGVPRETLAELRATQQRKILPDKQVRAILKEEE